jgi:hypothetical protein
MQCNRSSFEVVAILTELKIEGKRRLGQRQGVALEGLKRGNSSIALSQGTRTALWEVIPNSRDIHALLGSDSQILNDTQSGKVICFRCTNWFEELKERVPVH